LHAKLRRLIFVLPAVSQAALKNKPGRFIRQVIGSKYFLVGDSPAFPEPVLLPVGRGFAT